MTTIAVIGLGNMGRYHARVCNELEEVNLVAASDLDEDGEKIAQKYQATFYRDYKQMLEAEDIDAVCIAVPTSLHTEVALECIKRKKPILIEKPLADSLENARKIIQAAREEHVMIAVGHIERFNPAVQKLKQLMNQGKLENITSIITRRVGIFPPQVKDANVIIDLAVHDIDVCNFLLNKQPRTVYAKAGKALNSKRADYASVFLDYGDTNAFIQVNWITPVKIRKLNITGTNGYAELDYISQKLKFYESVYEKTFDSFGDYIVKFGTPNVHDIEVTAEEPLKIELRNFIAAVNQTNASGLSGTSNWIVSGDEGLSVLKIALKAVESSQQNRIIDIT